jgi:hypothetical protein
MAAGYGSLPLFTKYAMRKLILALFTGMITAAVTSAQELPVYVLPVEDTAALRAQYEPFLRLGLKDLLSLVPPQPGFFFSGSPATSQGAQENNLSWDLSLNEKVKCIYTGKLLPDNDYPENGYQDVTTPTGKTQRFRYHQAADGKKYWFEARRWYEQRTTMEGVAYQFARLYRANPVVYAEQGRRSALLLKQFAKRYPDYIIKYDYPGYDKVFFDAASYRKASSKIGHHLMEMTNWSYWGYHNISTSLLLAFDQLRGTDWWSPADQSLVMEMFDGMIQFSEPLEQVPLTNMHPVMWTQKAIAGNVLGRSGLIGTAVGGVERIIAEQFMYDGFYMEATVSYHDQTVKGLLSVLSWAFPGLSKSSLDSKITTEYPAISRAMRGNLAFRFPDGRYAAINDTHWTDLQPERLSQSKPELMPAAGHVVLGAARGEDQFQVHMGYAGWHGHNHYGNLGLILFAHGREMISDIGYTHTRARTWTMTTAAHNTVVVDGKSQKQKTNSSRAGLGDLVMLQTDNPDFQVVEVKASDVYPDMVTDYRRTLMSVKSAQTRYVVDLFQVAGGSVHDWILHGSADEEQELELETVDGNSLPMKCQATLVPEGVAFEELKEQGSYGLIWKDHWAYGHFKDLEYVKTSVPLRVNFRYKDSLGLQTWIPARTERTIYKTRSWAVRGANEDQGVLDDHLRVGVVVRSEAEKSMFVAVHVPYKGAPGVTSVSDLSNGDSVRILKISHEAGFDYIVYSHDESTKRVSIEGKPFVVKGKVTLIQNAGARRKVQSIEKHQFRLKDFSEHYLEVDHSAAIKSGQTAIIQHGDGHTTAFRIDSVVVNDSRIRLFTAEPVPFKVPSDGVLEMTTFPFLRFEGPHELVVHGLYPEK